MYFDCYSKSSPARPNFDFVENRDRPMFGKRKPGPPDVRQKKPETARNPKKQVFEHHYSTSSSAFDVESECKKMRQTFEAILARVLIGETSDVTRWKAETYTIPTHVTRFLCDNEFRNYSNFRSKMNFLICSIL